jgi:hypothetical protein
MATITTEAENNSFDFEKLHFSSSAHPHLSSELKSCNDNEKIRLYIKLIPIFISSFSTFKIFQKNSSVQNERESKERGCFAVLICEENELTNHHKKHNSLNTFHFITFSTEIQLSLTD